MYSIEDASAPSKKVYKFCRPLDLPAHKASGPAVNIAMEDDIPTDMWIYYCARQLKMHWRTVDPDQLEELANDLAQEPKLRQLSPQAAAAKWMEPELLPSA
jgi:hypothetical protein